MIRECSTVRSLERHLLLSPLVLTADLVLLLGSEVILDVEGLADLLGGLSLDHVGHGLAADIQQALDVQVVGSLGKCQCRIPILEGSKER